jgi:predicted TIM-barrel fold metal-dependent hydrolase
VTVDVNVSLGRWPFRRLREDEPAELAAKLRGAGVRTAWVGSFDAVFHRDLASANARLADDCRRHGKDLLVPFGTVNPLVPFWEDDLRRCAEKHRMPGLRLYPGWHGYGLDRPALADLLKAASERGLVVQLVLKLEDERTLSPLLRLPRLDPAPLVDLVAGLPRLRLVLLNWSGVVSGELLRKLAGAGQVYADLATVEGVGGVARLLEALPAARLLFGSHYPFYYLESAVLKLREAGLEAAQEEAIRSGNARRLLPGP